MGFYSPGFRRIIRQTRARAPAGTLLFSAPYGGTDVMNLSQPMDPRSPPSSRDRAGNALRQKNVDQQVYCGHRAANKYKLLYTLITSSLTPRSWFFANRKDQYGIQKRLVRDGINAAQLSWRRCPQQKARTAHWTTSADGTSAGIGGNRVWQAGGFTWTVSAM